MLYKLKTIKHNLDEVMLCLRKRIIADNEDKNTIHPRRLLYKTLILHPGRLFKVLTGRELNMKYVEVVITTACTLRCKGCSALMPQYKSHYNIGIDEVLRSIQSLMRNVDFIEKMRLIGGEPLLYPNLYDVLCYIKDEKKINQIDIVTNGTMLIKDPRVIDILKDDKFYVTISDYGAISNKKDELVQQLEDNGIRYKMYQRDYWYDFGDVTAHDCVERELREKFLYCNEVVRSRCRSLMHGKLYQCPLSSHGTNLGLIPSSEKDYVDLFDETISDKQQRKRIFNLLFKAPYTEACKYCNLSKNMNRIPVALQV